MLTLAVISNFENTLPNQTIEKRATDKKKRKGQLGLKKLTSKLLLPDPLNNLFLTQTTATRTSSSFYFLLFFFSALLEHC